MEMTGKPDDGTTEARLNARWRERLPTAGEAAVDLLTKLLRLDPAHRISVVGCLEHAYVAQFHDPRTESCASKPALIAIDDDRKLGTAVYRERLYHEISKMKRQREAARSAAAIAAAPTAADPPTQ